MATILSVASGCGGGPVPDPGTVPPAYLRANEALLNSLRPAPGLQAASSDEVFVYADKHGATTTRVYVARDAATAIAGYTRLATGLSLRDGWQCRGARTASPTNWPGPALDCTRHNTNGPPATLTVEGGDLSADRNANDRVSVTLIADHANIEAP